MARGGLYSGFEAYHVPSRSELQSALQSGIVAIDTNVLLNLYRYNPHTVAELLDVLAAAEDRLFVPHQVIREFWRNRQTVMGGLGTATKQAHDLLLKNRTSTTNAIATWAKSVALGEERRTELQHEVESFFDRIADQLTEEPTRLRASTPTAEDQLLQRLEMLLAGKVGAELPDSESDGVIQEGRRRVENCIPPGYMDAEKLESDLPEGASGDFIIWYQLLEEGSRLALDLVLVTSDTKEDWWNRSERGSIVGPRHELVNEYFERTGRRLYLLEPSTLLHELAELGIGTSEAALNDIERVRREDAERVLWVPETLKAVLDALTLQGLVQAEVIREAAKDSGRIKRSRVYELDNRAIDQSLRGFTRPVRRTIAELQEQSILPAGMTQLLQPVYESGVRLSHFTIPAEVVEILASHPDI